MICLGRSNFFKFNHPAEAQVIRAVVPSARISMAPVAFYPAVDNPEYFHMTAQNVGLGESPRVAETSQEENGQHELEKAPTLPRKNSLTNPDPKLENEVAFPTNNASDKSDADLSGNESDSDDPPEVPPRSEATSAHYVNSPSLSFTGNSRFPFLGEYLYTKAEMGPHSRVSPGTARIVPGAATVVSPNGTTSVHNALYRSFPAAGHPVHPPNVSSKLNLPPAPTTADLPLPETPAPPVPSISNSVNGAFNFRSDSSESRADSVGLPVQGHKTSSSSLSSQTKVSLEDLRTSELKKLQATEQRMREEEDAAAERARLDEILTLCAEYDRQQLSGRDAFANGSTTPTSLKPQFSSPTLMQNRIKTNGSLPREKRSHISGSSPSPQLGVSSPTSSIPLSPSTPSSLRAATPSEDELGAIFSFEGDHLKSSSLTRNGMIGHPSYTSRSLSLLNTPSPPPPTPRSPYENVSTYHPYPVPQSPRTRIRTTVGKDKRSENCEIFENKFAVSDFNMSGGGSPTRDPPPYMRGSSRSPERSFLSESSPLSAPPKPPRSPRIERGILNSYTCYSEDQQGVRKSPHTASVIDNKYFIPVTPKYSSKKPQSFYQQGMSGTDSENTDAEQASEVNVSSPDQSSLQSSDLHSSFESKIKNKVFEEQMLKNIQDTLKIDDVAGEIERLNVEKSEAIRATADLKIQIHELERQESESLRELEMERALLAGELTSTRTKLAQEEEKLSQLILQSDEMDKRHAEERRNDSETIQRCKSRLENAEDDLEETETKHEGFTGTTDEETEMLEILKSQHETVEAERKFFLYYIRWKRAKKIFEDTEFSQMESEAHRESEREELNKEISELSDKLLSRKQKICELETQMSEMTSSVCKETEDLENQRQELISRVSKERMRLSSVERQLGELARLGVLSSNGQPSPCSSDTEEGFVPELTERLAKLHLLDRSQDDLDRISQVTTSSPLGCSDASLGRKTSATLMEIERNRQLMLAKQGAMTIDNERRRVEELKRRVADEVKARWEEKKAREKRELNCASLNSIGSEDSSMTSSDLHTESISSDDVTVPRSSGESVNHMNFSFKIRQRGGDPATSGEEIRPVSDASSCCDPDLSFVKFRDKSKAQQRPLTRYLPVRPEVPFDLRQHIESAGHQIELCPYLKINSTSCRGYLHKLGSKFRTWQKRWFVFDRTKRTFVYYSDKSENKPKGGYTFQEIEEVYVDHLHSADSLSFCVKTHNRTFQLLARSPEAMRIWIDVIFTGAEGYREFRGGT